jgi:hypothetical protein
MENRRIEELHLKAIEYDAVKTERMRLTAKEVELKKELIALMELNDKQDTGYNMEGVEVEYVPGKPADPTIKVKVHKLAEELEEEQENGDPMSIMPEEQQQPDASFLA